MLCGNRRECLCSRNTWNMLAEDSQSYKIHLNLPEKQGLNYLRYMCWWLLLTSLIVVQYIKGYKSQVCGRGQPETSRGMFRQSKHRSSFSHFSTGSAGAQRMDSWRETSWSVRAVSRQKASSQSGETPSRQTRYRRVPAASLAVLVLLFSAVSFCWLSALCCLNCWISFRESERPVPSQLRQCKRV